MGFDAGPGSTASSSSQEQSLGPFLRAIGRHWLIVLIIVALSAGAAVFTVMRQQSTYEATTSVLVKPLPQGDVTFIGIGAVIESVDPTRTVQTAAALLDTPTAAQATATKLGPGWTRARVQSAVHVTPRGQSDVLAITAQGSSGPEAARLANEYTAAALNERSTIVQSNLATNIRSLRNRLGRLKRASDSQAGQIGDLETRFEQLRALQDLGSDPSLQLSQPADVPGGPVGTSHVLVVALAAIGGLILAAIAALALEFFTRRIRDEDELARLYGIPILAGIPKIRGARRGRLDPRELPPEAFEQVRLLRVQLPFGHSPTSVMITSANSGDGKTTTASALAAAIALGDEEVILLDLDLRKPGPMSMFDVERPLFQPRDHGVLDLAEMLERVPGLPRLRVMPAPLGDAHKLERFVRKIPDLLAQAKRMAGCVIVDAAPVGEVSDALRVATACDHAVFVARPRRTDRARFILTRDMLTRAGITPVGIVVVGQRIAGSSRRYDASGPTGVGIRQQASPTPHEGPVEAISAPRLDE